MKPVQRYRPATPRHQRGVVLFVALIMLVSLTIAAVALIRSVDTLNVITGNLAFKQATLQSADIGVEAAVSNLSTILDAAGTSNGWSSANASCSPTADSCNYYPTRQAVDAKGVPTNVNWANVPEYTTGVPDGYHIRYVIERLCDGALPITDTAAQCLSESVPLPGKKAGQPPVADPPTKIFYRVTVRADGPRATQSYVQAIISR